MNEEKREKLKETKHQQKFSFWDRFVYFSLFIVWPKLVRDPLNLLKLNVTRLLRSREKKMILTYKLTYNFMTIIVTYMLKCVCLCVSFE